MLIPLYVDVRLSHTNTRIYEQVIERDKAIAALKEAQAQAETHAKAELQEAHRVISMWQTETETAKGKAGELDAALTDAGIKNADLEKDKNAYAAKLMECEKANSTHAICNFVCEYEHAHSFTYTCRS